MRGVLLFVTLAASINAFDAGNFMELVAELEHTSLVAKNFTEGIVLGMQKAEKPLSKCYNSTVKAENSFSDVAQTAVKCAFLHIDQCIALPLVYDNIAVNYNVMSVDCAYPALLQKLKDLVQPAGLKQLVMRFFMNQKALRQKFNAVDAAFAKKDYLSAGKNIGNIIHILFDFTVTHSVTGIENVIEHDFEVDFETYLGQLS